MNYSDAPEFLRESPRFRNIPIISYHKSLPSTSLPDDILAGTINVNPYDDLDSEPTRSRKQYADFSLIDWNYEYLSFSKFNKERLLHSTRIQMFIQTNIRWLILLLSSFIMGVITIFLDYFSTYLHDIRQGVCTNAIWRLKSQCESNSGYEKWSDWTSVTLSFIHNETFKKMNNFIVFFTLSLIFGLASTILCVRQGNRAAKSGIAEIKLILAGYHIQDFLNIEMLANKTISLIFVVASGLYLGYEGPLVHLSCGIINFVTDKFPLGTNGNQALRRELLSSGIAVGIGLAFNAPIGGVLFGLEQIQSFFPIDKLMWNAFICSTLSVTLLQTLHPFKSVNIKESFEVNLKNNWLVLEFFPYMFLGLLCGFLGIVFNRTNTKFAKMRFLHIRENFKLKIIEVVIVVLVTNLFAYRFALTSTTLSEMLDNLFTDCTTDSVNPLCQVKTDKFPYEMVGLLLFTVIQAFLLTAYTYGCSVPGGVLMPSLVIGALVGRLTGLILEYIQNSHPTSSLFINCFNENQQCISVASYSLVGSGAFLAAVTKMNVTVVVILFEMTGAITYIIPIMLGVFFARFLNDL